MKPLRMTAILLLALLLISCTSQDQTIEVRGSVSGEYTPDYYLIMVQLTERGEAGPELVAPLEETLASVLSVADSHDLAPEGIEADQISLEQDSFYDSERRTYVPTEMILSRNVRLNVDSPSKMPALMTDLLQLDSVEIQRVDGQLDDGSRQQLELLESAIQAARERAERIARGDDREVGPLLRVSEFRTRDGYNRELERVMVTGSRMERLNVAFREAPVTVDVEIRAMFELK